MFINSSIMVLSYLIYFYPNLPSMRALKARVNRRPTKNHGESRPRRSGNPKSLASCLMIFSRSGGPTHKTHRHLRMPSTPGVGYRSRRYRIFPARRAMHAKCIKIRHGAHGPGCGSPHTRPTGGTRGWTYVGGGSAFVWRLAGGLNCRTLETPA